MASAGEGSFFSLSDLNRRRILWSEAAAAAMGPMQKAMSGQSTTQLHVNCFPCKGQALAVADGEGEIPVLPYFCRGAVRFIPVDEMNGLRQLQHRVGRKSLQTSSRRT